MPSTPAAPNNRTKDDARDSVAAPQAGDLLRARGIHGEAGRSGEILEILGRPGHERYRVRWDDGHESIVVPADGVSITHVRRHQ